MNPNYSLLHDLVKIRTIEEEIARDFIQSKIFSFLHLSVGQEASAVGVARGCAQDDTFFGNHRSHAHYLAKGGDLSRMIYEIYGNPKGCCKGHGGSMHMLDREANFAGSTPILGSVAPLGVGIAFSKKVLGDGSIAVIFIGDGASEEGAFYESINLAAVYEVPLLIILEDNKYCVNSRQSDRKSKFYHIQNVITGLGANYRRTSGADVVGVMEATRTIRNEILSSKRPAILHLDVVRWYCHSGPIREGDVEYRSDSLKDREESCCIRLLEQRLLSEGESEANIAQFRRETENKFKGEFAAIRNTISIRP